jgi:hypothetical protein
MTRKEINDLIESKRQSIQYLENEILELRKQVLLMSDDKQQYYEKEVEVIISKRPKIIEKQLHGFVKWKEYFKNEDMPDEPIEIERNMVVRINGEWI